MGKDKDGGAAAEVAPPEPGIGIAVLGDEEGAVNSAVEGIAFQRGDGQEEYARCPGFLMEHEVEAEEQIHDVSCKIDDEEQRIAFDKENSGSLGVAPVFFKEPVQILGKLCQCPVVDKFVESYED